MSLIIISGLIIWFSTFFGAFVLSLIPINKKIMNLSLNISGGIMLSTVIFSLLLPALEYEFYKFLIGFIIGIIIIMLLDKLVDKYSVNKKSNMLFAAIMIHNIPEGMLIGLTSMMYLNNILDLTSLVSIILGIAIQNIPEGGSVALSYKLTGYSTKKAIFYGLISGIVEPIFCISMYYLYNVISLSLVFFLASSTSIMLYVILTELVPQKNDKLEILSFNMGFIFMLCLEVLL